MYLRKIIVFFVLNVFLLPKVFAQTFYYENLFNSGPLITIHMGPPLVTSDGRTVDTAAIASDDRAESVFFCKTKDKYVCAVSEWFNFAFPLNNKELPSSWTFRGFDYKLANRRHVELFGKNLEVFQIESIQDNRMHRFLYSRARGLVSFQIEVDGQLVTFVSQRSNGFGHLPR